MKALALVLALLAAGSVPAFAQTTIASWDFETVTISGAAADFGPIAASIGTGSAAGHHAAATTTWSSPVGNGSTKSFSSNAWAVGDYYQFQASSIGSSGLTVAFDQTGSSTGPKDFKFSYSTDGLNFTQFSTYSVLLNGAPNTPWGSGSVSSLYHNSYDLSSISTLDNATNVYFRLIDNSTTSLGGAVVASGGTDRVDNFSITVIPEPSTYALLLGSVGFAGVLLRRRRCAQI